MKVLVMSDSHGDLNQILSVVLHHKDEIQFFVHLGDGASEFETVKNTFPDMKFLSVRGNCDYYCDLPCEETFSYDKYKIFATHGSEYNVKETMDKIKENALKGNYNIVLFGHTHKIYCENENNILYINPGSIRKTFFSVGSYAVINLTENLEVQFFNSEDLTQINI